MKRNAFTLIELLVVVAIISLLVAILLPSLQKAKELAKTVTCLSQLRSFGFAMNAYLEDNERCLPNSTSMNLSFYNGIYVLVIYLDPYLGNENTHYSWGASYPNPNKIWYCPADDPGDSIGYEHPYHGSSYDYTWQYRGQKIDGPVVSSWVYPTWEYRYEDVPPSEAPLLNDLYTHMDQGLYNVLFTDFHVASEPLDEWQPWFPLKP